MVRKILNICLFLTLLAGTTFLGLRYFNRIAAPAPDALTLVPDDAALILQMDAPMDTWKKFRETSLFYEDLHAFPFFSSLEKKLKSMDSLCRKDPFSLDWISNKKWTISLHAQGSGIIHSMVILPLEEWSMEDLHKKSLEWGWKKKNERELKGKKIIQISSASWGDFFLLENSYHLIAAGSESVLENVIQRMEEGLSEREKWIEMATTFDGKSQAQLLINHHAFSTLLSSVFSNSSKELIAQAHPYAEITELDAYISSSSINLTGFSRVYDSTGNFLQLFAEHEPQEFTAAAILPEQLSYFIWMGFNDGEQFYNSLNNRRTLKGTLGAHQKQLLDFETLNNCSLKESILSWIGNEMVLFSLSQQKGNIENQPILAVRINDVNAPLPLLNSLAERLDSVDNTVHLESGIELRRLKGNGLFSLLFGELFMGMDDPFYFRLENYVVFSTSAKTMENYILQIVTDRILGKNINYHNFVSQHLSDRSNITLYAESGKVIEPLAGILDSGSATTLKKYSEQLSRFEAFSWQVVNHKNGRFYNNIFLKYNPQNREESRTQWELLLDTTVTRAPEFVYNHIRQSDDIFIQDDNYSIYLITNKGKVDWKKQLEESIVGEVKQIDIFQNGKYQLLFTTTDKLYLIDLKGNYLNGFPVKLKEEVTAPLSVFDYEKNGNYRIFITQGNTVSIFDKEGKKVTGWDFKGSRSMIKQAPEFFRVGNKDYIFICDMGGNLYVLDRKGNSRFDVPFSVKGRTRNPVILESGKEIETSRIFVSDSSGNIIRYYFNGKSDTAAYKSHSNEHLFTVVTPVNQENKWVITLDSNKVAIREWNGKLLGSFETGASLLNTLPVFSRKDGSVLTGAIVPALEEVYLFDQTGGILDRFPVPGKTGFFVKDINKDGTLDLVTGSGGRRIFCYSFRP